MPQQAVPTVQNHFQAGLKTEFTGLNFPENAATDAQNVVFSLVGDVSRRGGINYENNFTLVNYNAPMQSQSRSSYRWLNAGGDGETQLLVVQIGAYLFFYKSSVSTPSNPLSTQLLQNVYIDMTLFIPNPNAALSHFQLTQQIAVNEVQYASGNGYLFVYHPQLDPFYCTFSGGVASAQRINLQIRDTGGIIEQQADNFRPTFLSAEHQYNLTNQGWTTGSGWNGSGQLQGLSQANPGLPPPGNIINVAISSQSNTNVLINGDLVQVTVPQAAVIGVNNNNVNFTATFTASVSNYSAATGFNLITLNVISISWTSVPGQTGAAPGFWSGGNFFLNPTETVSLQLINVGFINAWFSAVNNYPSNCDIWWLYKNTSDMFAPAQTFNQVQANLGRAPRGSYIFSPFNQDRTAASGIPNLTAVTTTARPNTGTFFAGRVWYAGVNASFAATGDEPFYTWTENLYFSQIIETTDNFGRCYQSNDPTSQDIFAIEPTDGGYISIQGCGSIIKLFPLRYGLLVFCSNGVWYISGSSGIGFTATDYNVNKISSIRTISATSFIDVQGYPMFWNEEGIYQVTPSQNAGSAHSPDIQLDVMNLTIGTILSYYNGIPNISKQYARGDYDYLNFIVQWCFRSTQEVNIIDRYIYDTILCYNIVTKAWYPYSLPPNATSTIADIKYIQQPGDLLNGSPPIFKYLTNLANQFDTFSEENDFTRYKDFFSEPLLSGVTVQDLVGQGTTTPSFVSGSSPATHTGQFVGYDYTSYFVTGYVLPGQGLRKLQTPYVYVFSRNPGFNMYGIRAIWDYAGSATLGAKDGNSGKWSTRQVMVNNVSDYTMVYKKVRLRGRGLAVQLRIDSASGQPFDIMGWSVWNEVNAGI